MTKETKILLPGRYSALSSLNRMLKGKEYSDSKFFILLDENTYAHCLARLITKVEALQEAEFMEVPAGEEAKSIEIANQLWITLLESGADRNSVIVNLGGGSITDLGGFVAAGFKRGIRYVNIPTTLIGMVDASIGGKTGVNLQESKNQVGFFYSPVITCIEPAFLDTLSQTDIVSGMAEVLKTLCVGNPDLYHAVCKQIASGNVDLPDDLIKECVAIKQGAVKADPHDYGVRKILNFGHTFGHGIESYALQQGQPLSHGMSVALGMWCAIYLSTKKLGVDPEVLSQYEQALLKLVGIPRYSLSDVEAILGFVKLDKKSTDGMIMCVLLQEVGAPVIDVEVDENEIRDALLKLSKVA